MPNGYDGMVGGGNMGTRWKSLGEGVDWLLFYHFCRLLWDSSPQAVEKSPEIFLWDSQWCSRLHLEAVAAHFGKTFTTFDGHWFPFPVESIFGCKKKYSVFLLKSSNILRFSSSTKKEDPE